MKEFKLEYAFFIIWIFAYLAAALYHGTWKGNYPKGTYYFVNAIFLLIILTHLPK
jgi:hypothetical protein